MTEGRDSNGHTKPAENTSGREEKRTTGVAISLEESREPKNRPNEMAAIKNAKPKVSKSDIFASLVTSKCSKL